jgi:hypothetical protein
MIAANGPKKTSSLSRSLKAEFKSLGLMMLYFACWLVPLVAIKNLLLEEYSISVTHMSTAIVGALILSKVVLVLEHVSLGTWIARQPAWVDVVLRTLLYSVGVLMVLLLEKAFEGRDEHGGILSALGAVFKHPDLNHVLVNTIVILGALLSFNIVNVVRKNLGDATLLGVLLKPLPQRRPRTGPTANLAE